MKLRKRDEVRFRRGDREYVGKVVHVYQTIDAVLVRTHRGKDGAWKVALRSIVRIETPKLTEKERAALVALREVGADGIYTGEILSGGNYARGCTTVRLLKDAGYEVTGRCLSGLMDRGLVEGVLVGINVGWTHHTWGLSEEGRRVAAEL